MEDGTKLRGRVIVGADGGRSIVAADLGLAQPGYAGYSAYRYSAAAAFQERTAYVAVCCPCRQMQCTTVSAGLSRWACLLGLETLGVHCRCRRAGSCPYSVPPA